MTMNDVAEIIKAIAILIVAIGGLAASIGTLVVSLRNSRKIDVIHTATNSMKDELVAAVKSAALAQGRQDEKDSPS